MSVLSFACSLSLLSYQPVIVSYELSEAKRVPSRKVDASVRYEHKTLRTLMKRSSLWYLPGVLLVMKIEG